MSIVYVLVNVNAGSLDQVVRDLTDISGVTKALPVTGIYDIIVELETESIEKALFKVAEEIHRIPNLKDTTTLVASSVDPSGHMSAD